ncbi:hypothetical protein OH805_16195 [Streptomyces sp. NBC_00879]|uniref:hypothetical protein n=1 Tax=Streptomyces sp. NBC_00879 TaxID=2975855 RepID=UPI003865867C|nr:hypothetical protein OH805_16195 [Streptomyces sp. NBC_00879]
MTSERDLDFGALLKFDQERGLEGCRHDAGAAGRRGDARDQAQYLQEAAQLEMLPRLWEFGVQLTEDEYKSAVRVRSWMTHEQAIARHRALCRYPSPANWSPDPDIRYFWSQDGHLLYVTTARDDGRFVANRGFLTPEWAEHLRRDMPQHAHLVTLYEKNQAAGRGHEGVWPPLGTPLEGVSVPEPLSLWRERIEGELRRRATEQAQAHDADTHNSQDQQLPDADPAGH